LNSALRPALVDETATVPLVLQLAFYFFTLSTLS
jgi:hypothetical protein